MEPYRPANVASFLDNHPKFLAVYLQRKMQSAVTNYLERNPRFLESYLLQKNDTESCTVVSPKKPPSSIDEGLFSETGSSNQEENKYDVSHKCSIPNLPPIKPKIAAFQSGFFRRTSECSADSFGHSVSSHSVDDSASFWSSTAGNAKLKNNPAHVGDDKSLTEDMNELSSKWKNGVKDKRTGSQDESSQRGTTSYFDPNTVEKHDGDPQHFFAIEGHYPESSVDLFWSDRGQDFEQNIAINSFVKKGLVPN